MQQLLGIDNKALERRLAVVEYIFDESNQNFHSDDQWNQFFIQRTANYFNDLLRAQGFVFLNDVLKALGLKPRVVGQIAGWTVNGAGFIHIEITQRRLNEGNVIEYFLKIEHEGVIIFDVLGD